MDISKYNTDDFKATYSPEDNKLRLYTDVWFEKEEWLELKANGWRHAPVQDLIVCHWSVENEDFCFAIAGDIMPEEMTMVERAELKADRLLVLAKKRSTQCLGYQKAANDLMLRIGNSQPILKGHHSQRKAERVQKQIDRNIEKAQETSDAVGYWVWRAKGVIDHADYKNNTRTISNRIKKLLKDLRTQQKALNSAAKAIDLIYIVKSMENCEKREKNAIYLLGCGYYYGFSDEFLKKVRREELTSDLAIDQLLIALEKTINSSYRARTINHILNRLAYEQEQLCIVPLFDGQLTPAILQTFLRTHGAEKPKVTKTDFGWLAVSPVCLPLHIGSSSELELDDNDWRELMQSLGYEVPAKKKTVPILNFKTEQQLTYRIYNEVNKIDQVEMSKAEYMAIHKDRRFTMTSACGTFRYKVAVVPKPDARHHADTDRVAVFLSDSKIHPAPESIQSKEVA